MVLKPLCPVKTSRGEAIKVFMSLEGKDDSDLELRAISEFLETFTPKQRSDPQVLWAFDRRDFSNM